MWTGPGEQGEHRPDQARRRHGHNPGDHDVLGHVPAHRRHAPGRAHADDGAGDGVGGGNGNAQQVRQNRVMAPAVSAQTPCMGVRWVMREPMVRTMRQPPNRVPSAIAAWQASTTQNGT